MQPKKRPSKIFVKDKRVRLSPKGRLMWPNWKDRLGTISSDRRGNQTTIRVRWDGNAHARAHDPDHIVLAEK